MDSGAILRRPVRATHHSRRFARHGNHRHRHTTTPHQELHSAPLSSFSHPPTSKEVSDNRSIYRTARTLCVLTAAEMRERDREGYRLLSVGFRVSSKALSLPLAGRRALATRGSARSRRRIALSQAATFSPFRFLSPFSRRILCGKKESVSRFLRTCCRRGKAKSWIWNQLSNKRN